MELEAVKFGKADIGLELVGNKTYLRHGERQLIELGVRPSLCYPTAKRVTELHSAIVEWFVAIKFG